jgi:hypothetical protein
MTRYVTYTVGCDWADCGTVAPEDDDVVSSLTVSLDGKPGREFQLCKTHREQLVDEILTPLMQKGIKVADSGRARKPAAASAATSVASKSTVRLGEATGPTQFPCQVDGCGRVVGNRTGLAQHVTKTHGYAHLADYDAEYPSTA